MNKKDRYTYLDTPYVETTDGESMTSGEITASIESKISRESTTSGNITRRDFIKLTSGGIIIFFFFGSAKIYAQDAGQMGQQRGGGFRGQMPDDFNAFLRIGEDGKVTCFTGKIEMGQGVIISLAQMLAEELEVSLDSVQMIMGDTDLCPWDMGTFGSLSTRMFGPFLVAAAAEARAVLMQLGSEALKIPLNNLTVKNGLIIDRSDPGRKISYAALSKGKRIERRLGRKPSLKPVSEYTKVGKPIQRQDAFAKVTGKARYAGDIRLPGMLYAKILRPPAHGTRLLSADTSAVESVKGARIIRDGPFIAVLHEDPEEAEKALRKIKARFDTQDLKVDEITIFEHLLKVAPKRELLDSGGSIEKGMRLATEIFNKTYLNSYVAHAPMEPHTAVAQIEKGKVTVWASTQTPFSVKNMVAQAVRFPPDKVRIITPPVGGGFGGKSSQNQQAVEAALLAKLAERPVQVAWSREEEFFYDVFRPAAVVKIDSGIQGNTGKIVFWDYTTYFAGLRGATHPYDIPHHRTAIRGGGHIGMSDRAHPFRTGPWRAPGANTNIFARESQIDIMAAGMGMDPLDFRLKNLKDKRMIRALKAAASKFGWIPSKASGGRGYGVACGEDAGSYVAHMAEVDVDRTSGQVQVKRIVCAQDMGLVINPEGAKMQMEGCVMMGLGYALTEEVHFKGGKISDLNFGTYEIPRFSWLPKIETVLIDNRNFPPQGGGEPAIVCMGAVIANAIYDALGIRLYQLPMTPDRVKEAMKQI